MLLRLAASISRLNRLLFKAVAWLSLAMVALYFLVVLLRYAFGWGSVGMQESVVYLHATLFMLAIAAGIANDTHVRVDIFYGAWSRRRKALVNALGGLLLMLPFAAFLLWSSWDYVGSSWRQRETSTDAGGLPYIYVLKTLMPVMALQLLLQAVASVLDNLHRWREEA